MDYLKITTISEYYLANLIEEFAEHGNSLVENANKRLFRFPYFPR